MDKTNFTLVCLAFLFATCSSQRGCKDPADVIIIMDSSRAMGSYAWAEVHYFVRTLVADLGVSDTGQRVGLLTYGTEAYVQFHLNTHNTATGLLQAISDIQHQNERGNLTAALERLNDMFVDSKGDRQMSPNVAVLFVGSIPEVNREGVILAAQRMRQRNIRLFVVGVGREVDRVELRAIATDPDDQHFYHARDTSDLNSRLRDRLVKDLCREVQLCTEAADLVFILDTSGSVVDHWRKALDFAKGIIDTLPIGPNNVRVAAVVYSNYAYMEFGFDQYYTRESLKRAIDRVVYRDENTNTSGAIRLARTFVFNTKFGDRLSVRDVAIVITDGEATWDKDLVNPEAEMAHKYGIQMYSIGLGDKVNLEELRMIASDPDVSHMAHVTRARDFVDSALILKWTQCQGDDVVCSTFVDLVIVLDSSGSIGERNFQRMLNFVRTLIFRLNIDGGTARVAIVTFGNRARINFGLTQHRLSADAANAIYEIKYEHGKTNTSGALRLVREQVFNPYNGDRPDVPNICMVITDGGSDSPDATFWESSELRDNNVTLLALGVGDEEWIRLPELRGIASEPRHRNVVNVRRFDQLDSVVQALQQAACNERDECLSEPCQNRGRCVDDVNGYNCACAEGYAGNNCQYECSATYDLVLAVDGSGSVGEDNYYAMLEFLRDLVDSLPFPGTRVGLLTFSDNAFARFHLDKYSAKKDIMNAIYFRYMGGRTETAEALKAANMMFSPDHGDRPAAKNVLLLLTDGRSSDPLATWRESVEARRAGTHIIVVGVGDSIRKKELEGVATGPDDANLYVVNNFNNIKGIKDDLLGALCGTQNPCEVNSCSNSGHCLPGINMFTCVCPIGFVGETCQIESKRRLDVVFLLDLSGSLRQEDMRYPVRYIKNVVREMDVSPEATRVALITFSETSHVQFNFGNYTNKYDVMHALDLINYLGKGTRMAPALELARRMTLNQGRSSFEGYFHYFVVITDDLPSDLEASLKVATDCKNDGVELLVVGLGINDAQKTQFYSLASFPPESTVKTVSSVANIELHAGDLIDLVVNDIKVCASNPCQNGAECYDAATHYYVCLCPYPYTGYNCERTCSRQMDIAILLDVSADMSLYDMTRIFLQKVVEGLQFTYGNTRVAFITFDRHATLRFGLNVYKERQEFLNALTISGGGHGTNIEAALRLMTSQVFRQSLGDRPYVINRAIILSDGFADRAPEVNVGDTIVYTVGLGQYINQGILEATATAPASTHMFLAATKSAVTEAANTLLNQLCS